MPATLTINGLGVTVHDYRDAMRIVKFALGYSTEIEFLAESNSDQTEE